MTDHDLRAMIYRLIEIVEGPDTEALSTEELARHQATVDGAKALLSAADPSAD